MSTPINTVIQPDKLRLESINTRGSFSADYFLEMFPFCVKAINALDIRVFGHPPKHIHDFMPTLVVHYKQRKEVLVQILGDVKKKRGESSDGDPHVPNTPHQFGQSTHNRRSSTDWAGYPSCRDH